MSDAHEGLMEASDDFTESRTKSCISVNVKDADIESRKGTNMEDRKDADLEDKKDTVIEGKKDTDLEDKRDVASKKVHDGCDDITEEQENKLLADDCEDLDVIDCYTEDFESDMEADFCRKEACKADTTVKIRNDNAGGYAGDDNNVVVGIQKNVEVENNLDKVIVRPTFTIEESGEIGKKEEESVVNTPNQQTPADNMAEPIITAVVEEDNDDDMIQVDDEHIELLLIEKDDVSHEAEDSQSEISVNRVTDQKEQELILQKPLIKQIVPEIDVSEEENEHSDDFGSQESLNLQIDHFVAKASELSISKRKESVSETGIQLDFDADTSDNEAGSCLENCHTEDADFHQLKLEFYENVPTIENEAKEKHIDTPDIKEHPEQVKQFYEAPKAMTDIALIKEEPVTPVKERIKRLDLPENTIPTISLTSSDEEYIETKTVRQFLHGQVKTAKRKSKKKKKSNFSSPDTPCALLKTTFSERSIDSLKLNDSDAVSITSFDDNLGNSDRIISLRKRKVKVLPEASPHIVCHRKSKRSESDPLKEPAKRKKRDDPFMRGYKRRKPYRSGSKSSTRSVSTAGSSLVDEEIVEISTGEDVSFPHTNTYCSTDDTNKQIDESFTNEELQIHEAANEQEDNNEMLDSTQLKEVITKELESELSAADNNMKNESQNVSDISLPEARTDIALEDMLEDLINREEEKKKCDTFCSISLEEKFIMESLFDDCDKQSQPSSTHVLDQGTPMFEKQLASMETDQIMFSYTISENTSPISLVPISTTDQQSFDMKQFDHSKGPQFKLIQNYDRYKKLLQPTRPSKPVKVIEPLPRQNRRKRADSDEDYRPHSYLKKRLFSRPRKRVVTKVEGSNFFRPTGEYLSNDDVNFKNMPSLEEDLAMTSSDNYSIENGNAESSSIAGRDKCNQMIQPDEKEIQVENVDKAPLTEKNKVQTSGKKVIKTGKRGRPPIVKDSKICGFFCSTTGQQKGSCNAPCCQNDFLGDTAAQQSQFAKASGKLSNKKAPKKREKKLKVSSFDNVSELFIGKPSPSLNTESSDDLSSTPSATIPHYVECVLEENECAYNKPQEDYKMVDNLQVVISPLTDEKIRKINTPKKKRRGLAKACQTEISGLTWSIELDRINFCSEYFEKLRALLNSGAARNALRRANDEGKLVSHSAPPKEGLSNLDGVDMCRDVLHSAMHSPASAPSSVSLPEQATAEPTSQARSSIETLLFQKSVDVVETPTTNRSDESAQKQLVKSLWSSFRIPKLVKQPSTSPQPVTSSTPSVMEAYFNKDDEEPICSVQLPSSSRESTSSRATKKSTVTNRPVDRDYIDDETESYPSSNSSAQSYAREDPRRSTTLAKRPEVAPNINRRDSSSSRPNPLNFANALNFKYDQVVQGEDDNRNVSTVAAPAASNVPQVSIPLENRIVLPDRSEMMNVKRTIRNDISQPIVTPQVSQQPPQAPELLQQFQYPVVRTLPTATPVDYKFNQQQLPGFNTFGTYGSGSSFNKGYQNNSDIDIKPSISNMYGNWGSFGRADVMNPGGQPEGFNNFVAMLYEQYKQVSTAPSMPINMAGPGNLPFGGQWFPPSAVPSMSQATAVKPQLFAPSAVPPMPQVKPPPSMLSTSAMSKPIHNSDAVEMICCLFGCYDFFVDKCIKLHCRLSHVLPHEEEVLQKLSIRSCDFIMTTYRFVNSRDDLFVKYFPVYAGVMGRNKMRHQLVDTIQDCEKPKRPLQYYRYIVDALKMSGTSPTQAVQILLDKHKKTSFHQINVLIELILATGEAVPTFLRWLEDFLHVKGYSYDISTINRLLEIAMEQPSRELAKLISKVVLKVTAGNEYLINTTSLLEFAKNARQYPDMELDVEDIVKKYGSVVMRV